MYEEKFGMNVLVIDVGTQVCEEYFLNIRGNV